MNQQNEESLMKLPNLIAASALLACAAASAQDFAAMHPYAPKAKVEGTLVVWGNDGMIPLEKLWEAGFQKFQPGIKFDDHLHSTAAGIGGLYAGHADLAYMGRDIWPVENLGFTKTFGYDPTRIVVATGAYEAEGKTFPMVVFVNKQNPLSQLTLRQLDAIFGTERRLGGAKDIRTWGDLGLGGDWAERPIHLYAYANDSGFGVFFSAAALGGSTAWNCGIHQFENLVDSSGKTTVPAGLRVLDALAADKDGLAYSGSRYAGPGVKSIAIAASAGAPFIAPTRANVLNRTYPLLRDIPVYINKAPGKPVEPKVREFLDYVLSREGQQAIGQEGDYLPLTAGMIDEQRNALK